LDWASGTQDSYVSWDDLKVVVEAPDVLYY